MGRYLPGGELDRQVLGSFIFYLGLAPLVYCATAQVDTRPPNRPAGVPQEPHSGLWGDGESRERR